MNQKRQTFKYLKKISINVLRLITSAVLSYNSYPKFHHVVLNPLFV